MTYMTITNDKNYTLSEKNFQWIYQDNFSTGNFQKQIWPFLKPSHHSILKDTKISLEHIHS